MNIQKLTSELKFANRIGQNLSTEEIVALQASVLKLSYEYQYEVYNFWGRVEGTAKNYYIIEAVNFRGSQFPTKKYFWSSQDFIFAELPPYRKQFIVQVKHMSSFFTGQHEKIISKDNGQAKKVLNLDGDDFVVKTKNFTELDRLSIVVHHVNHDCQVVPLGAYKMIPTHQLIRDPTFRGLKMTEATNIQNYVHLRAPEQAEKKLLIQCDKALQRSDFLDELSQDPIKESWSIQTDESKTEITIRSLVWPGYVGYHRANSPVFGGVYLGTGVRNEDIAFLV